MVTMSKNVCCVCTAKRTSESDCILQCVAPYTTQQRNVRNGEPWNAMRDNRMRKERKPMKNKKEKHTQHTHTSYMNWRIKTCLNYEWNLMWRTGFVPRTEVAYRCRRPRRMCANKEFCKWTTIDRREELFTVLSYYLSMDDECIWKSGKDMYGSVEYVCVCVWCLGKSRHCQTNTRYSERCI